MTGYLLKLLDGGMTAVSNPGASKAQIVKALKAMARCLKYGDQVQSVLNASTVWAEYKDQKHDLFITDNKTSGYLTGLPLFIDAIRPILPVQYFFALETR